MLTDLLKLTSITVGYESFQNVKTFTMPCKEQLKMIEEIFLILKDSLHNIVPSIIQRVLLFQVWHIHSNRYDLPNLTAFYTDSYSFYNVENLTINGIYILMVEWLDLPQLTDFSVGYKSFSFVNNLVLKGMLNNTSLIWSSKVQLFLYFFLCLL